MGNHLTEKNHKRDKPLVAVRIYLTFTKVKSRVHIQQDSRHLDGRSFLVRERYVRTPYAKHMRIALSGTIKTTLGYYKKHFNKRVTHIGIYLSEPLALTILERLLKRNFLELGVKLVVVNRYSETCRTPEVRKESESTTLPKGDVPTLI